jgi:hypothetical protein
MTGLRDHVARAIEASTFCGGPDILRAEEVEALMRGALQLEIANNGKCEQADTLRLLAVELGANHTPFMQAKGRQRIDTYYLYCADVSIAAYDQWLAETAARRRLSAPPRPSPPAPRSIPNGGI